MKFWSLESKEYRNLNMNFDQSGHGLIELYMSFYRFECCSAFPKSSWLEKNATGSGRGAALAFLKSFQRLPSILFGTNPSIIRQSGRQNCVFLFFCFLIFVWLAVRRCGRIWGFKSASIERCLHLNKEYVCPPPQECRSSIFFNAKDWCKFKFPVAKVIR